jgi:hypothetical protein
MLRRRDLSDHPRNMDPSGRPAAQARTSRSGFCQRSPRNRAKSPSVEHSVRPWSIARAARCASGTSLALIPSARRSLSEYVPVLLSWLGDPGGAAGQPLLYLLPNIADAFREPDDSGIADDANESQQRRPRQAHCRQIAQTKIEPTTRRLMERRPLGVRVDKKIGVDQDQR